MTNRTRMQALLAKSGIPAKEIKVFGSQILIKCYSRDAAEKFAGLLAKFATVRGVVESYDYAKVNRNTMLRPSTVQVWLVGAHI